MRPRALVIAAAFATFAASTATPRAAFAQQSRAGKPDAAAHLQRGVELYDENDFTNALIEFKRYYEISNDYRVLFNVAQTAFQIQNYASALDAFQKYLSEGGSAIVKDRRAYVEKEIQKLKGRVAQVRITVNVANADIAVDDEKVGTSPLDHPITVSQGKRRITATVAGKSPVEKTIEVAGGDSTSIALAFEEATTTTTTTTPPPPIVVETHRRVPWVFWGIAGGLAAAWGATGVIALVYSQQAKDKLSTYGVTSNDISAPQNTAQTFALVSDIALGCTLVGVGVALIMTFTAKPESTDRQDDAPKPASSHGISAFLSHVLVGPGSVGVAGQF